MMRGWKQRFKSKRWLLVVILLQMYIDDIMTSLETDDEAIKAQDQLRDLLGKVGFKIRRWCSNRPEVLRSPNYLS